MTILRVDRTTTQPSVRRSMVSLFAAMAFHSTGAAGALAAGALISTEIAGPGLGGLPNAATVLGTAAGALTFGSLMARSGRRFGLLSTYVAGTAGALLAFAGALDRALPLLVFGMLLLGLGQGGAHLSRYVAAELYPASRKGFAISAITWSATVGAIFGPSLIAPAARAATWQGWPGLAGPFALAALAMAGALLTTALLPRTLAASVGPVKRCRRIVELRAALRRPVVRLAVVAMAATYAAMLLLMLMTPVQLGHHGQGLDVVGLILSAHMIGMFALAPVSGRIADRLGGQVTIGAGIAVLAMAAALAALLSTSHDVGLPVALFLLGFGWNLTFVGGGSVLSRDLPAETRIQLQGLIDAIVWGSAVLASLSAGPLFEAGGYPLLAVVAASVALAPLTLLVSPMARSKEGGRWVSPEPAREVTVDGAGCDEMGRSPIMTQALTSQSAPDWLRQLAAARTEYEELFGWPVDLHVTARRLTMPVGRTLDAVRMPAALGALVLKQLRIMMLDGPVIIGSRTDRLTFLTGLAPAEPRLPADLERAWVTLVERRDRVVLPTAHGETGFGNVRWFSPPSTRRTPPAWSVVIGVSRRVVSNWSVDQTLPRVPDQRAA